MFRVALITLLLAGCWQSDTSSGKKTTSPPKDAVAAKSAAKAKKACPEPAPTKETWRHRLGASATSKLVGDPGHAGTDPVVNPGEPATVRGKFAYGKVSKDLEDEKVSLYLRMGPCGSWREVGSAITDDDGRAAVTVPARLIRSPGAYAFQLVVRGDLSRAYGTIYVIPKGTKAVVFDIDATLTKSNRELYKEIAYGKDQEPRPRSVELVRAYVRAGYVPIFISGRHYVLRESTRAWLIRHGYPPGPLITTNSFGDALPGQSRVGAFKTRMLETLQGLGMKILYAYGDASTDVCAYANVGIDPKHTFIFSDAANKGCNGSPPPQRLRVLDGHLANFVSRVPRAR